MTWTNNTLIVAYCDSKSSARRVNGKYRPQSITFHGLQTVTRQSNSQSNFVSATFSLSLAPERPSPSNNHAKPKTNTTKRSRSYRWKRTVSMSKKRKSRPTTIHRSTKRNSAKCANGWPAVTRAPCSTANSASTFRGMTSKRCPGHRCNGSTTRSSTFTWNWWPNAADWTINCRKCMWWIRFSWSGCTKRATPACDDGRAKWTFLRSMWFRCRCTRASIGAWPSFIWRTKRSSIMIRWARPTIKR